MNSRGRVCQLMSLLSLCCMGMAIAGCSAQMGGGRLSGTDHESLIAEYQGIADRAIELVTSNPPTDPAVVTDVKKLAEKVVDVTRRKLTVVATPTPDQAARYAVAAARFQEAMHAACPTCPKR